MSKKISRCALFPRARFGNQLHVQIAYTASCQTYTVGAHLPWRRRAMDDAGLSDNTPAHSGTSAAALLPDSTLTQQTRGLTFPTA